MSDRAKLVASISVPTPTIVDSHKDFMNIYTEFIEYLKTIDFSCLKPQKITKANYKSRSMPNNINEGIKKLDVYLLKIEDFMIQLSSPQYLQYLNELQIPDRPDSNSSTSNAEQKEVDYNTRLKYYVRELVNIYQLNFNNDIRKDYINLTTFILSEYNNSKPKFGTNTVHFRFKATKGLILKLAKKILFERFFC